MAIDPTGTTAYVVGLDRSSGAFLEVDAVAMVGGRAQPIIRAQDLGSDSSKSCDPLAGLGYYRRLAVSMDGRWVVLAGNRSSGCDLVAVPTDGGAPRAWPGFGIDDTIVGIADDLLIGSSSPCDEAICDGFVVDLGSGIRWPLGGDADIFNPIQLIAGPHGPLVLGEVADDKTGTWQVEALDLTDRTRSVVFAAKFTPLDRVGQLAEGQQAALPAGWFLIYRNTNGAPSEYPDYSAGMVGGTSEVPLPVMSFPRS